MSPASLGAAEPPTRAIKSQRLRRLAAPSMRLAMARISPRAGLEQQQPLVVHGRACSPVCTTHSTPVLDSSTEARPTTAAAARCSSAVVGRDPPDDGRETAAAAGLEWSNETFRSRRLGAGDGGGGGCWCCSSAVVGREGTVSSCVGRFEARSAAAVVGRDGRRIGVAGDAGLGGILEGERGLSLGGLSGLLGLRGALVVSVAVEAGDAVLVVGRGLPDLGRAAALDLDCGGGGGGWYASGGGVAAAAAGGGGGCCCCCARAERPRVSVEARGVSAARGMAEMRGGGAVPGRWAPPCGVEEGLSGGGAVEEGLSGGGAVEEGLSGGGAVEEGLSGGGGRTLGGGAGGEEAEASESARICAGTNHHTPSTGEVSGRGRGRGSPRPFSHARTLTQRATAACFQRCAARERTGAMGEGGMMSGGPMGGGGMASRDVDGDGGMMSGGARGGSDCDCDGLPSSGPSCESSRRPRRSRSSCSGSAVAMNGFVLMQIRSMRVHTARGETENGP
jgi:hypothetical protein